MSRRRNALTLGLLVLAASAFTHPAAKWPPWLSIEAPVNPFEPGARGAVLLVHTALRDEVAQLSDLSGSAEGLVNGARVTVPLRFEATKIPGVFALQRQWRPEGAWVLRIAFRGATAIVGIDANGTVASVRVPTERRSGIAMPRAVAQREIDSTLFAMAR